MKLWLHCHIVSETDVAWLFRVETSLFDASKGQHSGVSWSVVKRPIQEEQVSRQCSVCDCSDHHVVVHSREACGASLELSATSESIEFTVARIQRHLLLPLRYTRQTQPAARPLQTYRLLLAAPAAIPSPI